ncbi:Actin-interacting protein 1 [Orchesella cincta]|uniref:Actin-interacting protein 1 n=1 Tax=Orchesella cincta TaxID=48709 RepID=A0A1D2M4W3_ORCCI|nr:Actin-interacting protein 1 [Orchesella cincta]
MSYTCRNTLATLPRTQRGAPIVLGGDPKGKNFLYCNGNSVIIRNIDDPSISDTYTEHSLFSPSGFYISSGDNTGRLRIWDTVNKEHILKSEFTPFRGPIKDISWSADSQRMVVGEGREKFGHVFMSDTGTSVGEISGQSKPINSCDFKPTRPFRIITGSEDNTIGIFEGPPFKFKMTKTDHSGYVFVVKYSPNGELFASGGFDHKVFIYQAKDSQLIGQVGSPAHTGGVYGVAFSPDSKQLLTASGDKTCKLWDVETRQLIATFPMGNQIDDQQVSCLWQGPHLLTVSLGGFITYLDVNNPSKPLRIVKGHNKPITVMCLNEDRTQIFTGCRDGFITYWDAVTGVNDRISGTGHGNQINGMKVVGSTLYTCGIDDTLRLVDLNTYAYTNVNDVKLGSQPRGMDINGERVIIATVKELLILENGWKVGSLPLDYEPSCLAINPDSGDVAVGGSMDNKTHVYVVTGNSFSEKATLDHLGPVTDVKYSPDGNYLAASDGHRKVVLYSAEFYGPAHNKEWGFHSAKVNCVAWSPDSKLVVSGSLDTTLIVWSVEQPAKHLVIKNAHPKSQITRGGCVLSNSSIVSTDKIPTRKYGKLLAFPNNILICHLYLYLL